MAEEARHDVRPATAADRDRVARTLASAFADDPVLGFLLPEGVPRREARLRGLFELEVSRSERTGGTWITDDGAGAAVWFPPGRWRSEPAEELRQLPRWLGVLGRRLLLAGRVRAHLEQHHAALPDHWYLLYLGVEPGRQGQGLGSALLHPVLERCDRDGLPAYLEASSDRNRALYARHGFADRGPLPLPSGGPPVHPMCREPA